MKERHLIRLKEDRFALLNKNIPSQEKLHSLHELLKTHCAGVERIAVALYEEEVDDLKTYIYSSSNKTPLQFYHSKLSESPSLLALVKGKQARVIDDLALLRESSKVHSVKIQEAGFQSSYTFPMFYKDDFIGFIFFNSKEKESFTNAKLNILNMFSHLICDFIVEEQISLKTMIGAFRAASNMVHFRDPETGNHLERMARYSVLIARELAKSGITDYNDEDLEHIFRFAPLHDIGKISIPDSILLKPGRLNDEEKKIMNSHTKQGGKIFQNIVNIFNFTSERPLEQLKAIIELHHETLDGTGYPYGKKGDEIPYEARIIAVADIFDALTSARPYKEAWSNEAAFTQLEKEVDAHKIDSDCVKALKSVQEEILEIQDKFNESQI